MGLAFTFKLSLYLLTGFVGIALGLAEYGPIPFFSVPITLLAYWWCETSNTGGEREPRGLSENLAVGLGMMALIAATFEFFSGNSEGKLLAGIHLVVYLTWIVLLQQKSVYRCWLLLALGIMHVAVGSVLTNSSWYGLTMVVYLFAAIWTLSLFSMYRAALDFAMVDPREAPGGTSVAPELGNQAQVISSVRFDDSAEWISMRLVMGVMLTALGGLVVGGAFFALIPRVSVGTALGISDDALPSSLRNSVMATEIKLGDMGPTLNSNDLALSMRLFDNQTNRPLDPQVYAGWLGLNEPLFRTSSLTEYYDGKWRADRVWTSSSRSLPVSPGDAVGKTVRQEIHLERLGTDILPCMGRAVAMHDSDGDRCARMQPLYTLAERREWHKRQPGSMDYVAYSALPDVKAQSDPGIFPNQEENVLFKLSKYKDRCKALPKNLQRLQELTDQLIETAGRQAGRKLNDLEVARLLESYLRDSGDFTYSLDLQVIDGGLDPVEDFVFNRRTGHCQYFASALALMFRAAGIPSRLIMGFKGGESQLDGELKIEKRFAHAWVEAWIDNRKWMTFDATPEDGRAESITQIGTKRSLWSAMVSKVTGLWETNILDISYERQEDMIYEPLRERLAAALTSLKGFAKAPGTTLSTFVMLIIDPRNWMTLPGVVTLTILFTLLWLLRLRTGWLWLLPRRRGPGSRFEQAPRVDFYERFVRIMQLQGRQRDAAQTQGEFVQEMAAQFADRLPDLALRDEFASLGDLFYLVRFGEGVLTPAEQTRVETLLGRLERELALSAPSRQQSA